MNGTTDITYEGLLRRGIDLVKAHPLPLALPFVLWGLVTGAGDRGDGGWRYDSPDAMMSPDEVLRLLPFFAVFGLVAIAIVILLFLAYTLLSLVVARAALDAYDAGHEPDLGRAYADQKSNLLGGAGVFILAGIAVIIGFILLIVPGFILLGAFLPLAAIVAAERKRGADALSRSWDLAKGHKGKLLLIILTAGIANIITDALLGWMPLIGDALAGAANGLVLAVAMATGVVFYKQRTGTTAAAQPAPPIVEEPGAPLP